MAKTTRAGAPALLLPTTSHDHGPDPRRDKWLLRRRLRPLRRALSPARQRRHALAAARAGAVLWRRFTRIGFYIAADGELDPLPLLNDALWAGRHCFLPQVPARPERRLAFTRLAASGRWYTNRFGIPELRSPRPVRAWQLQLLLLPLVAFDARGRRLGMGGGFYDASLAYLRQRRHWRRPLLVGMAHGMQEVPALPEEPWDVPLDAILTETGLRWFRQRALQRRRTETFCHEAVDSQPLPGHNARLSGL